MPKSTRQGALFTALLGIEWLTIAGGVVASAIVLGRSCMDRPSHRHDDKDTAALADVKSACNGGTGTLATLRAWLDGAELPAEPSTSEPVIDDALRARGASLFADHCATCHGAHGEGNGPTAAQLQHPPANFTVGTYELRTTEHEALPADLDLFRTITRGVHGTAMPPWFALPERDRWALAAHLKTLSKQFSEDEAPPPVDVTHPPEVTAARVAHGHQLYETAGCASCHGASGRGDGPAASSLTYKSGAPARPRDLRIGRFHRGTRVPEIYLTLVTGLDGTPMASFAKVLSADDLWDVAMYVHELAPPAVELAGGIRCLQLPSPTVNADEVVGARQLMPSLHTDH
jgi:mono/diheme cytochrome c family protein